MMNPMMDAINKARALKAPAAAASAGGGMAPGNSEMDMPMGLDKESGTLLMDRSLFKGLKVKPGDEITVTGKVTAIGNKIGFSPESAEMADQMESPQGGFDEGLDGEIPPAPPVKP
jgi:hypothetical protein